MHRHGYSSDAGRWQQIERVFFAALDCPTSERAALLAHLCADDPDLRNEVEALLTASDQQGGFLEALDAEQATQLLREASPPETRRIGPYEVVRELGRGGMGVVLLAERADGQFERHVALKLIKRGMDSDAILRRFLNERRILARLQHPHIARLLDGGITDDGQPYFAMEYVEGVPLDTYCDEQHLTVDARLRLFQDVGRAVQYAHQNLVVHRDLKPSNMLVTPASEGTGSDEGVKLLDFGIAKLLDAESGDGPGALTQEGTRVMTPEYAAPEQLHGEPVTTATDVYALGVVLYELLTGHRPYRFLNRTDADIEQIGRADAPPPPSTAISHTETVRRPDGTTETRTPEQVSRARGTQPNQLRRRLAGDLDTIVLKALQPEPERRYASVEAFMDDIRRHLAGLPVTARRDTLGYRAHKFVRRHRAGMAAVVVVVLSLAGGLGVALWQARAKAQEAATAEAVTAFVIRLFEQTDPNASPGEDVTARQLLERSPEQIERALADQPAVQAKMLDVVSQLHMALGLYDEAAPLLQQALALRRTHFGAAHSETAHTLSLLGGLAGEQSRYAEAERHLLEALEIHEAARAADPLEQAETLVALAIVKQHQGHVDAAEQFHRQALALRRQHLRPDHPDLAESLSALATTLRKQGQYGDETDSLYQQALSIHRRYYGDLHSGTLEIMSDYTVFLQDKGDHTAADRMNQQGLHLARELYGASHPEVGHRLYEMGRLAGIQDRNAMADSLLRQALSVYRAAYGDDHAYVGVTLFGLGKVQGQMANYEEAERLLRDALRIYRQRYGEEHPYVAMNINQLARVAVEKGNRAEAERLYRLALDLYRRVQPAGHPITGTSLRELGALLLEQGRAAEAAPLLTEAEESWATAFDEDDWRLLEVRQDIGACLLALGRFEEAEAMLLRIYPVLEQTYGVTDKRTTATRALLVDLYTAWGTPAQAAPYR